MKKLLFLAAALAAVAAQGAVETYTIDPVHSSMAFSVRHIVSKVPGAFTKFEGKLVLDRDHLENSSATAEIDAASIDTRNQKRDNHLRSPDFFEVAKFPSLTFKSTKWTKTGDNTYDIAGDLTIKDHTNPVVLHATLLGFSPGMQPGSQVTGWEATTMINRHDYGIKLNPALEAAVGADIDIHIGIEADLVK